MSTAESELGPLDHLLAVSDGKPFANLSWRLLQRLVDGVAVERRELGEGDTLNVDDGIDTIYIESGSLKLVEPDVRSNKTNKNLAQDLRSGQFAGTWDRQQKNLTDSPYQSTMLLGKTYEAGEDTVLRVFYMRGAGPLSKRPRAKRKQPKPKFMSAWDQLCACSVVARRALLTPEALKERPEGEVALLKSTDLVEYLPALTDLLAQAMANGVEREEPPLKVCVVRYEKGAPQRREWCETGAGQRVELRTADDSPSLAAAIKAARLENDYVFVDPYDRASDLGAVQVKALTTRGRVADVGQRVDQTRPGTTLEQRAFDAIYDKYINSVVHVARNFRVNRRDEDADKLNFHAVVLDSRTARFESGGTRDRQQRRNADSPIRTKIDPPEGCDDDVPTTRLHLNLLRLKKAWEQSPRLADVCDVLDEPNVPATGDRRGYWSAESFFARWVRDVRFRRVGVALGGGGATGFCHVALLHALRNSDIPIDMVSGTSFGAVVGAYYCSHGLDGLQTLTEQALLLTGVASLTMITSAFFEHLVNLSIDYRPMWELPIPLHTVATDIETGKMVVFPGPAAANPSVGFAVRASGALPGFFAPALAGDARYVDGGAVSLVPARALIRFGADVVIGSNAFPFRKSDKSYRPSALRAILPPPFGGLAERVIAELNPGNRMVDAARSMSLSLTDAMQKEMEIASALYEHKRTDVKYWEFHLAGRVLRAAAEDLKTSGALPAAIDAVRLLNQSVAAAGALRRAPGP
jgi:predicted acylesterase/phospholipase RssA